MPMYEYECQACHRRTEKIQKYSDAELTVCPHCGGRLERTITAAGFAFKGGGWYADGYGSAKGGDKAAAESKPADAGATPAPAAPAAASTPAPAAAPAPAPASKTT